MNIINNINILDTFIRRLPYQIQHKFLFMILYRLINNEVDEICVFNLLVLFHKNQCHFSKIPKIINIIKILEQQRLNVVSQFIILILKHRHQKKKLFETLKYYGGSTNGQITKKINSVLDDNNINNDNINNNNNNLDKIQQLINDIDTIVKSFDDRRFINFMRKPKLVNENGYKSWEQFHADEVYNRLCQMIDIFGHDTLHKINITMITESQYFDLEFLSQVQYFSQCCTHLRLMVNNLHNIILKINVLENEIDEMDKVYFITNDQYSDTSSDSDEVYDISIGTEGLRR